MGIIIVNGWTFLQFQGPIIKFENTIGELRKLQNKVGKETLMIDTVPLPDHPGILIAARFNGQLAKFEEVIEELVKIKGLISVGTWPTPDKPGLLKIGTWPVPDLKKGTSQWIINVSSKFISKK